MSVIEWVLIGVGVTLHVLVLSALLRGPVRDMPFFFGYVVVVLLSTVVESTAVVDTGKGTAFAWYYWGSEFLTRGLLFATLLHMLTRAWRVRTPEKRRGGLMILVLLMAAGISFAANHSDNPAKWMTGVSRDLNFASALLNVSLWLALLRVRTQRIALLVVSALGVQMTGAAIGHSLRYLSASTVTLGNYVIVLSHLLCFFLCWRGLRGWEDRRRPTGLDAPVADGFPGR